MLEAMGPQIVWLLVLRQCLLPRSRPYIPDYDADPRLRQGAVYLQESQLAQVLEE